MNLELIERFRVTPDVVRITNEALKAQGKKGFEAFVLWTGAAHDGDFTVRNAYIPGQIATRTEDGVCVTVNGVELHRLNVWLFERSETLACQVHTHPTEAYHSETDDTFPIVTALGGLSIVVPYFARNGIQGSGVAAYRLRLSGWHHLNRDEFERAIHLES
jgi:hypothetical protein